MHWSLDHTQHGPGPQIQLPSPKLGPPEECKCWGLGEMGAPQHQNCAPAWQSPFFHPRCLNLTFLWSTHEQAIHPATSHSDWLNQRNGNKSSAHIKYQRHKLTMSCHCYFIPCDISFRKLGHVTAKRKSRLLNFTRIECGNGGIYQFSTWKLVSTISRKNQLAGMSKLSKCAGKRTINMALPCVNAEIKKILKIIKHLYNIMYIWYKCLHILDLKGVGWKRTFFQVCPL